MKIILPIASLKYEEDWAALYSYRNLVYLRGNCNWIAVLISMDINDLSISICDVSVPQSVVKWVFT